METKELIKLLKFLAGGAAKDITRPGLACVHISEDRKVLTSTDGHQLRRVKLVNPLAVEGSGNSFDHERQIKRLGAGLNIETVVTDNMPFYDAVMPKAAPAPLYNERGWPLPQDKVPTEPCHGMNPALLGKALSDMGVLLAAWGEKDRGAHISVPANSEEAWRIDANAAHGQITCVVMPMRV
jgi:hypothetical protein